jgi:transposase-like protein
LRSDGETPFKFKKRNGPAGKRTVLGLVERAGRVRTFHIAQATKQNVASIVRDNIAVESMLFTDESRLYPEVGAELIEVFEQWKKPGGPPDARTPRRVRCSRQG